MNGKDGEFSASFAEVKQASLNSLVRAQIHETDGVYLPPFPSEFYYSQAQEMLRSGISGTKVLEHLSQWLLKEYCFIELTRRLKEEHFRGLSEQKPILLSPARTHQLYHLWNQENSPDGVLVVEQRKNTFQKVINFTYMDQSLLLKVPSYCPDPTRSVIVVPGFYSDSAKSIYQDRSGELITIYSGTLGNSLEELYYCYKPEGIGHHTLAYTETETLWAQKRDFHSTMQGPDF